MRQNNTNQKKRTKRNSGTNFKDDMIYFEGKVVETFPGTVFGVEVTRKAELPPP